MDYSIVLKDKIVKCVVEFKEVNTGVPRSEFKGDTKGFPEIQSHICQYDRSVLEYDLTLN